MARVAARSTSHEPDAIYLARVVYEVTDEATGGMLRSKVAEVLPDDLRQMVPAGKHRMNGIDSDHRVSP